MNQIDLAGRTAVVTGGGQGVGLAIAKRLKLSGARLMLWDRNPDALAAARAELEEPASAVAAVDIADQHAVEAATAAAMATLGRIDILINNAALIGPNGPLWEYPVDDWRAVMDVGLTGTFLCSRAIVPGMRAQGYGRILNVASIAGKEGNPNASAYSAMKAGVIAMTKSLGKELAGQDIAVNAITPAVAATPGAMKQAPSQIEYMLSRIPRGRFVELDEIAAMAAWIVSAENSFTTGAVFDLSGGRASY